MYLVSLFINLILPLKYSILFKPLPVIVKNQNNKIEQKIITIFYTNPQANYKLIISTTSNSSNTTFIFSLNVYPSSLPSSIKNF